MTSASRTVAPSRRKWLGVTGLVLSVAGGVALMSWAASESRENSSLSGGDAGGANYATAIGDSAQADAPRPEPSRSGGGRARAGAGSSTTSPGDTAAPAVPASAPGRSGDATPDSSAAPVEVDLQIGQLRLVLPSLVIEPSPDHQLSADVKIGGFNVDLGP